MKMDAMQKRRMWKVAIAHFVLTALICLLIAMEFFQHAENVVNYKSDFNFWFKIIFTLQPQIWVSSKLVQIFGPIGLLDISGWCYFLLLAISIPIWSFCFGWLYVKFTNWLNHFPVLGKKVF